MGITNKETSLHYILYAFIECRSSFFTRTFLARMVQKDRNHKLLECQYGSDQPITSVYGQCYLGSIADPRFSAEYGLEKYPESINEITVCIQHGDNEQQVSFKNGFAEFSLPLDSKTGLERVSLCFNIHSTSSESQSTERVTGIAVTRLGSFSESLWRENSTTSGRFMLPVVSTRTLRPFAEGCLLRVEIVVVTPLPSAAANASQRPNVWQSTRSLIIGHRGNGKNFLPADKNAYFLQLGENTISSFIKAGEFGADFVEFDVQLTSDNVPVLYHNFTTTETGTSLPMNHVSLDSFLAFKNSDCPKLTRSKSFNKSRMVLPSKLRANSTGTIQEPYPTLKQTLKAVPESLGFNIEIKYPSLDEALNEHLNHPDMNLFCDAILDIVLRYGGNRNIEGY